MMVRYDNALVSAKKRLSAESVLSGSVQCDRGEESITAVNVHNASIDPRESRYVCPTPLDACLSSRN